MRINVQEIAEELYEIVNHSAAAAILANDWLFDPELPVPSVEVTVFIASHLLRLDPFLAEVGKMDRIEGLEHFISLAKKFDVAGLAAIVENERPHLEATIFENMERDGSRVPEWTTALKYFQSMPHSDVYVKRGMRGVAKMAIETLVMRAVFLSDSETLKSLALSVELLSKRESPQASAANKVAAEILRWTRYLRANLGDGASKTRMQEFLIELGDPDAAIAGPATWSQAFRKARWGGEKDDRRGSRATGAGTELAKRLKEELAREAIEP